MKLGNRLFHARKKSGFSQEAVAEKLGVSRQTISKWEPDETVPDIYQSKKMAKLYRMTLDELIEFDVELDEIQKIIDRTDEKAADSIDWTDEKAADSIDWTSAWGKKYPILSSEYSSDRSGLSVSIHLMFLLIGGNVKGKEFLWTFQYISCFY